MFYDLRFPSFSIFLLLLISFTTKLQASEDSQVLFKFYDQNLALTIPDGFKYVYELRVEEMALRGLYKDFERRPYQVFLADLQATANTLQLNDWLYAQLIRKSLQALYSTTTDDPDPIVEYSTYFLLAKSGYDVRLTYRDKLLQVNVFTNDILYEIPLIQDNGRQFANISSGVRASNLGRSMYLLDQQPQRDGRAFSFLMNRWPSMLKGNEERTVVFEYRGHTQELKVRYNPGVAALLRDYPLVDEQWYMDAPLSEALQLSLLPQLRKLIQGKSRRESLELLVAFTRSAFVYKDDKIEFGGNKPMVADELFYYPFSDCEDRSALFYSLVKTLLGYPMIVIAYEDHLSIAVAVPGIRGDAVTYNGKVYIFCDPTGPQHSSEIGVVPQGYENQSFEIIGSYQGDLP